MPIPQEILDVERPVNTIVVAYGKNKDKYAVRQRVGCKNIDGRRIPVTGPPIGHIVDLQYVPMDSKESAGEQGTSVVLKDWANVVLCDRLMRDVQKELCSAFGLSDAMKLFCIAILRVCYPGIRDEELKDAYQSSFLSELCPGVSLSPKIVAKLWESLGAAFMARMRFWRNRTDRLDRSHPLLVGLLVKERSGFGRTLPELSTPDPSRDSGACTVMYAFDLKTMEPVCADWVQGTRIQPSDCACFLEQYRIPSGMMVGTRSEEEKEKEENWEMLRRSGLHLLVPVPRTSGYLDGFGPEPQYEVIPGRSNVKAAKRQYRGKDLWAYAFQDENLARRENLIWQRRADMDVGFDSQRFSQEKNVLGSTVLLCDLDLPPETVYLAYAREQFAQIGLGAYSSACEYCAAGEGSGFSVRGTEFCDFLAAQLSFRLLKTFDQAKLLQRRSMGEIMTILAKAQQVSLDGVNWQMIEMNPGGRQVLLTLDLVPKPEQAPKQHRPARPRKPTTVGAASPTNRASDSGSAASGSSEAVELEDDDVRIYRVAH